MSLEYRGTPKVTIENNVSVDTLIDTQMSKL